MLELVNETAVD